MRQDSAFRYCRTCGDAYPKHACCPKCKPEGRQHKEPSGHPRGRAHQGNATTEELEELQRKAMAGEPLFQERRT